MPRTVFLKKWTHRVHSREKCDGFLLRYVMSGDSERFYFSPEEKLFG